LTTLANSEMPAVVGRHADRILHGAAKPRERLTSSMFWMNLQQRYDLWHAERERERRGAPKIRPMKKTA
jgi:hypothetical protein